MEPEQVARLRIDALLAKAGWQVVNIDQADIHAHRGVAIREFPLNDEPSPATSEQGESGRSRGRAGAARGGGSRRFADRETSTHLEVLPRCVLLRTTPLMLLVLIGFTVFHQR